MSKITIYFCPSCRYTLPRAGWQWCRVCRAERYAASREGSDKPPPGGPETTGNDDG